MPKYAVTAAIAIVAVAIAWNVPTISEKVFPPRL